MGEAKRRKARDPNYGKQRVDLSKQKEQIEMMFAISLSSLGFMHSLNSNIPELGDIIFYVNGRMLGRRRQC